VDKPHPKDRNCDDPPPTPQQHVELEQEQCWIDGVQQHVLNDLRLWQQIIAATRLNPQAPTRNTISPMAWMNTTGEGFLGVLIYKAEG
jgi:hypothetical protein